MEELPTCETCHRPRVACVCDRVVRFETAHRVLILQHPQEQDAILGTSQLLTACLPKATVVVGLSWKNLAHALGEEDIDPRRWAVLFPDREAQGEGARTRGGDALDPTALDGIIVLDGTWSKAKTLWWRNPWLNRMNRLTIAPKQASIYGSLRLEPRREYVSTLESVAAALTVCGEPPEIEAGLQRILRTLVQRVRDAHIIPPPAGHTRKARVRRARERPGPGGTE